MRQKSHFFIAGLVFFILAAITVSSAHAQVVAAPGAFGTFMATATGVGQYTVGFGSGGVPMLAPSVPTIHVAGATPVATFSGMFPAASGRVPMTVTATISAVEQRAAIARFLGRSLPILSTGFALYEVAKELGFIVVKDPDDSISFLKKETILFANCDWGPAAPNYTPALYEAWAKDWIEYANGSQYNERVDLSTNPTQTCIPGIRGPAGTKIYHSLLKIPGGSVTYVPATREQFLDALAAKSGWPSTSAIAQALADAGAAEEAQGTAAKPAVKIKPSNPVVTGPATGSPTVSTGTKPSPTGTGTDTETKTCTPMYVYSLAVINTTEACGTTLTRPDGTTTTTGTTTAPAPARPEPIEIETCGLPGKPKCQIEEKGTPEPVEETKYKPKLDDYKSKQGELKDKVSGESDKSFLAGWSAAFVTPPIAACTGYVLPREMGTINPCPVVDGVRSIMAYIWALTALFLAVGMVKKVF